MPSFDWSPSGYDRNRDLPRLLALWPEDAARLARSDLADVISRLARAIRAERRQALAGRWTYDLARHAALIRAHSTELEALRHARRRKALEGLARRPDRQQPHCQANQP